MAAPKRAKYLPPRQDRVDFLDPDLVERTDLLNRTRAARIDPGASEGDQHLQILTAPLQAYAFEVLDEAAGLHGIELRFPFWDRDLVQFCVSLPSDQKLANGWSRLILRRAMTGILPPVIQWRRDKLDFTPHLVSGMLSEGRHKVEEVLGTDVLAGYADLQALRNAWYRIVSRPEAADGLEVQAVWRAVSVGNWLRDPQGRDVELRVA